MKTTKIIEIVCYFTAKGTAYVCEYFDDWTRACNWMSQHHDEYEGGFDIREINEDIDPTNGENY